MGRCHSCGTWVGWGEELCPTCEEKERLLDDRRHEARVRYASTLLSSLQSGVPTPLPSDLQLPVTFRRWERCYFCTGMTLYQVAGEALEDRRSRTGPGPAAEWVPGKQRYVVKRYDAGILAVTESRLLFAGDKSSFNIYHDEIMALRRQVHADGSLLALSACTLPVPIFFGYVEYWRGKIDPVGESFVSALEVTIQQLVRRRTRVA